MLKILILLTSVNSLYIPNNKKIYKTELNSIFNKKK